MNLSGNHLLASGNRPEEALSLIELIGVLAVIAILAAVVLPNLLHQLDVAVSQQEVSTLQGYGNALQSSICRNSYIPGKTDWATNIATEMGIDPTDVATNSRNQPRVFLIDPNFQVGTNAVGVLPYTQSINGSAGQPVSPRLMILSTIGKPLPTNVGSASSDFSTIWNTPDGTPPTGATGFSSWTANNGSDLKVQRINLTGLFVQLVLTTNSSANNGYYAINPSLGPSSSTNAAPISAYYIQNSVLRLMNGASNVTSDQVLSQPSSFVYYQGAWANSIGTLASSGAGGNSTNSGIALDFNSIVTSFLAAPSNTYAAGASQTNVITNMLNYLNAYDAWAASGFSNNTLYNSAVAAQTSMMGAINSVVANLPQ